MVTFKSVILAFIFMQIQLSPLHGRVFKRAFKNKPEPRIVWKGDSLTLQCISTLSKPMFWHFAPLGMDEPFVIYNGEKFKDSLKSEYSMIKSDTGDENSLVIKQADKQHAGRYECQDDDGFGDVTSAEVIVVSRETRFDENTKKCIIQSYGNVEPTINCTAVSNKRPKRNANLPTNDQTVTYECLVCLNVNAAKDTPATKQCLNTTYNVNVTTSTAAAAESSPATNTAFVGNGAPNSPEEQVKRQHEERTKTEFSIIIPVVVASAVGVGAVVIVLFIFWKKSRSCVSADKNNVNSEALIYNPPSLKLDASHAPVHQSIQPFLTVSSS